MKKEFSKKWASKRLVNLLSCDINKLPAYKMGIIDSTGKQVKKTKDLNDNEKKHWSKFEKTSLYIRRILRRNGIPHLAMGAVHVENAIARSPDDEVNLDDFWAFLCLEIDEEDDENIDEDGDVGTDAGNLAGFAKPFLTTKRKGYT